MELKRDTKEHSLDQSSLQYFLGICTYVKFRSPLNLNDYFI